jgi:hypothetical protein
MEQTNWCNQLFYLPGEEPAPLPKRFRLPTKETRYSHNCTLADIHKAGYVGPVDEAPYVDASCVCVWCLKTNSWKINKKETCDSNLSRISEEVYLYLKGALNFYPEYTPETITSCFRKNLCTYKGEILMLIYEYKNKNRVLTWEDIPDFPDDTQSSTDKRKIQQNRWLDTTKDVLKKWYEKQGLVLAPLFLDTENFVFPDDWIVGTEPIDPVSMAPHYIIPSGYYLNSESLATSGYYYVSKDSNLSQTTEVET